MRLNQRHNEAGAILFWVVSTLFVMLGMAAFSVDIGMNYWEQRRIAFATDAGALAGVQAIIDGAADISAVKAHVVSVAQENGMNSGSEILADSDIRVGTYDGTTFTDQADVADAEAVLVHTRRTVPSVFASIFGIDSLSRSAQSLARMNITTSSSCIRPFGLEHTNFPYGATSHTYDPPITITTSKNSPGNWGKVDIPDAQGNTVNMSSYPNFQAYMTGGQCGGPLTIGNNYSGGTGSAALKDSISALLGEEITMLVVSPFGNGNSSPITLMAYAVGKFLSISGNGANVKIDIEISEIRSDPGTTTGLDTTTPRILVY